MKQQAVVSRCELQGDKRHKRKRRIWMLCGLPVAVVVMTAAGIFGSGAWFTNASVNAAVMTAGHVDHTKTFTYKDSTTATGDAILTVAKLKPNAASTTKTLLGSMALTNTGDIDTTFTLTVDTPTGVVAGKGGGTYNLTNVVNLRLTSDAAGNTVLGGGEFLIKDGKANISLTPATVTPTGVATVYIWANWPDNGLPGSNTSGDNAYQGSTCNVQLHWTQTQA